MQIISRRGVSLDVGKLWGEIRGKYDNLEDDENLVQFFTEVLQMRDELEENENNQQRM